MCLYILLVSEQPYRNVDKAVAAYVNWRQLRAGRQLTNFNSRNSVEVNSQNFQLDEAAQTFSDAFDVIVLNMKMEQVF